MSTFSMVLRHIYFYNTAAPRLLFPRCCPVYAFSTLLRHVCCAIAALSTLLRYVYFFHVDTVCLLRSVYAFRHAAAFYLSKCTFSMLLRYGNFFYAVSPWLLFKRCCAKTTFSTLLHYDYFSTLLRHALSPHCCAMATFLRCCAISTLSTMQRHVYFFHAAAPYLLFLRCCAVFSFSTRLLRYDPLFHDWQNYVLTRTVDIKPFLANYYRVRWASQYPLIGLALFFFISIIYHSSEQTVKSWSDAEFSSVWSDSALFDYVLKYDAIWFMRSYRDGDRILQNSLVLIIFCYSFRNRFIFSFLGNHYSLTFQFGS